MTKKSAFILSGIVVLLLVFSSPLWLWLVQPDKKLDVLIVDKTVPDQTYREHQGITWLLNHLKLKKENGTTYREEEDYVGFIPTDQPPDFRVKELPEDLSPYEVLYIADGYGVYEDEYVSDNQEGARSELLYGGMTSKDVSLLSASLIENNQTLIAEFNTFGSPTEQRVREEFYELLNLRWTGWMGRYFNNLANDEVPVWLKQNFENQYGEAFAFKGEGLVFVNEADKVVVLNEKDITDAAVQFKQTDVGPYDLDENIQYNYWFDVVEANNVEEVQANFELKLKKSGEKKLAEANIPLTFPAVIHHEESSYDSYYFAGDFADQEKVPAFYKVKGIAWWQKLFSFDQKGRTETFYWKAYVPMMKEILSKEKGISKEVTIEPEIETIDGMKVIGKSGTDYLQVYKNGEWEDILIKGVNMGIAKPGSFPGETSITKSEYARWFKQISELNANAIRVYTIHPPAYYQALYEHNRNTENPIYLFHGVWVNEETFLEKKNAFDPAVTDDFKAEIQRTVDIINGNAEIEERPGHASGKYVHDLSPYLLGWVLGVEWDPEGVIGTNESNPDKTSYSGTYIKTENASPFEAWLAEMMDFTAVYEAETYGWQHPVSFTNWPTTDLLEHPSEPSDTEDMVSVNPNVIKATDAFYPGLFASYHFYPYYPDFMNYEEKYVEYKDHRGEKNNYAGYLHDMKEHHDMPLLVAEFGIPASRGLTHENVHGFNQGFHSEQEQGKLITKLYGNIVEEKMAGGLVFSWQDEWFKRTWNTMDYDNPDRRPFWDNIQTNEQHFGLLSFEPDTKETQFLIDGDTSDWEARGIEPVQSNEQGPIKNVYIGSDARALYFRIDFNEEQWNEDEFKTSILLNTIGGQGQSTVPDVSGVQEEGIDFLVELNGKNNSRVLIDSYYDTFHFDYGHVLGLIEEQSYASEKNNGIYHPIRLTLSKQMTIQKLDETLTVPFSAYETGKLMYGNGNPDGDNFNSLADFIIKDGVLELRLPWLMLNVKDPSQKQIIGDMWSDAGIESEEFIESIFAAVIVSNKNELEQRVPTASGEWIQYTWENWEKPIFHERLKKSYDILRDAWK